MPHLLILIAVLGQSAPADPNTPDASVRVFSSTVDRSDGLSEAEYRELVRCTLARNGRALEAWIDTRFQLGSGHEADYRRANGRAANLPDVLAGCHQLRSGTFPFSLDRLARDWADRLGVTKEDPQTLEKVLKRMGRVNVTSVPGYAACIRQKNSQKVIRDFLTADGAAKVEAFMNMSGDCAAAPGASLTFSMSEIDRALRAP